MRRSPKRRSPGRRERQEFEIALEIITEGKNARISERRRRELFDPSFEERMSAIQARAAEWIWSPSVQALAVGEKTKKGRETGELAIVVFVDKKRPRGKLRHPVPKRINIPRLGSFVTDVEAIGELEPQTFSDCVRPAMPGCSIGHEEMNTMGTFGLLVRKRGREASNRFVLSNAHVLALDGLAKVGDGVVQPGPGDADGTCPNDKIAELADWVQFDFSTRGFPNKVDAAIARVSSAGSVTATFREIPGAPAGVSFRIENGMRVHKVGRTTDETSGTVKHKHAKVKLRHMKTASTSAKIGFSDQVMCTRYSSPGDSGSAVLNDRDEVIGLHAAGSISRSTFNRIENVFALLNLELA